MIAALDTTDHMTELDQAIETVIDRCLGVKPGERVVVVVDAGTRALGDALRDAAAAAGGDAVLTVMDPRGEHGEEPPAPVAAALAAADVFIAPTTKSLSHTRARKAASEAGARGATLPGVTEDMLARLMACDYETLRRRSAELARLITARRRGAHHLPARHGSAAGPQRPRRHRRRRRPDAARTRSGTCRAARASPRR